MPKMNDDDLSIRVEKALNIAKSLVNTPYVFWTIEKENIKNFMKEYMYVDNIDINLHNIDQIKEKGTNCAGLTNIIRRTLNLSIPGINLTNIYKLPGGTDAWLSNGLNIYMILKD
jgi:hypothetical protein